MSGKSAAEAPLLTRHDLNRATLARQMLLKRERITVLKAIEKLVGLQAQIPRPPFVALWSRLEGFRREDLASLYLKRKIVRATMMRATIHAVSTRDFLAFRPLLQPALMESLRGSRGPQLRTFDMADVLAEGSRLLSARPRTFDAIRRSLRVSHPDGDDEAMAAAVRMSLPLVQMADNSRWSFQAKADFALAEIWLGEAVGAGGNLEDLFLRYLGAFGPASIADAQKWSGLRHLKPVFAVLRPKLRVFRDEEGRELFDLPRAPRPSVDIASPARFLPDYDNLFFAYANRGRIITAEDWKRIWTANSVGMTTFLLDGFVAGAWRADREKEVATLFLKPLRKLAPAARAELEEEGRRLLDFIAPEATKLRVRFAR